MADFQGLEDRELISLIVRGEKDALECLYNRYIISVYSLAMFMLKQEPLAQEATQDVFLNIWLKASSYKAERGEIRTWVMSIAHHKIVDVIRSRRRAWALNDPASYEILDQIPSPQISTAAEVERSLDREYFVKLISTLPPTQREVIMLAYYEGYSQSEIANKLQQPLGTVKTRVRLAMQKLRAVLERDVIE